MRLAIYAAIVSAGAITSSAHAESAAEYLGRQLGTFSGSAGTAAMVPLADAQPQWITIQPRSKADCLAASNQVLNERYLRCRRGWQEYARLDAAGRKVVLSERPIPRW